MGSHFNFRKLKATTNLEAVQAAEKIIDRATQEDGDGGYSGSWAECRGVSLSGQNFESVTDAQNWLSCNARKWGPLLIVKVGKEYAIGAWCSS